MHPGGRARGGDGSPLWRARVGRMASRRARASAWAARCSATRRWVSLTPGGERVAGDLELPEAQQPRAAVRDRGPCAAIRGQVDASVRASSPSSRAIWSRSEARAAAVPVLLERRAQRATPLDPYPRQQWRATTPRTPAGSSSAGGRAPGRCTTGRRRSAAGRAAGAPTRASPRSCWSLEALLCLSVWGPQPLAWLWIGSQVDYHADSNMLGIVVAFFGILASLLVTLALATAPGPLLAAPAARRGPRPARGRRWSGSSALPP